MSYRNFKAKETKVKLGIYAITARGLGAHFRSISSYICDNSKGELWQPGCEYSADL